MTTRTIPRTPVEFWLWPNLLTLQAPLVAVLWQQLLARSLHVNLNPFEPWALAMSVWLVYVADHLIDTVQPLSLEWEPPRKEFCRKHWHKFLIAAMLVGGLLGSSVSRLLWAATVHGGWQLSIGVACYFVLIHFTPAHSRREWPREIAVATLFTLGTFGAVWLANGQEAAPILTPALLFILLCWMNCSAIETWEWEASGSPGKDAPNHTARWIARHLPVLSVTVAIVTVILPALGMLPAEFAVAVCLSSAALAWLGKNKPAVPGRFVSLAADLALCTPLLVLAFASR